MGVCLGWAGALGGVMWRRVKLGLGLGERAREGNNYRKWSQCDFQF